MLCGVPNRRYGDAPTPELVKDNVRSAADDQLTNARLGSRPPKMRMTSQGFHDRDDACRGAPGSIGSVQSDVGANLPKTGSR